MFKRKTYETWCQRCRSVAFKVSYEQIQTYQAVLNIFTDEFKNVTIWWDDQNNLLTPWVKINLNVFDNFEIIAIPFIVEVIIFFGLVLSNILNKLDLYLHWLNHLAWLLLEKVTRNWQFSAILGSVSISPHCNYI